MNLLFEILYTSTFIVSSSRYMTNHKRHGALLSVVEMVSRQAGSSITLRHDTDHSLHAPTPARNDPTIRKIQPYYLNAKVVIAMPFYSIKGQILKVKTKVRLHHMPFINGSPPSFSSSHSITRRLESLVQVSNHIEWTGIQHMPAQSSIDRSIPSYRGISVRLEDSCPK
jgi:hypothetical protein